MLRLSYYQIIRLSKYRIIKLTPIVWCTIYFDCWISTDLYCLLEGSCQVRFFVCASRSSAQEPVLPSLPGWPVAGWLAGWLTAGLLALSLNSTQTCIWVSFLSCSLFSYGWPFHLVTMCNQTALGSVRRALLSWGLEKKVCSPGWDSRSERNKKKVQLTEKS